jgi:hypothetical protein
MLTDYFKKWRKYGAKKLPVLPARRIEPGSSYDDIHG